MSRKIARITQEKKLLLANEVVEDNTKIRLDSDGRLDTNEIIEYPAELEGGRNLALMEDYSHDNRYQTVTKTDETFNEQPVYRAIKKTTSTPPTSIGSIIIRKGETFTASIWIKHEQQPTLETAYLIFYKNTTLKSVTAKNNYGEWERLIVTYTNNTDADIENVYIYFYPARGVGDVTYFTCPQIEKGSQATPWTPAPEDLGLNYPDSIQNFNSSISGSNIIVPEFIEGYPFVKPVIDDSLVLWLDGSTGNNYEQTGTWKDLSGNGNHGQLMNFGYTEDSGWVDGGLKFDGVDDTVILPNIPDLKPSMFSIDLILKPVDKNNRHVVFVSWTGYTVELNTEKTISFGLKSPYLRTPILIEWGKLIHITCVYDGKTQYIYVNGKFSVQKDETLSYSSSDVVVSSTQYGAFKGSIFDVKFYNRALTDEEILQNYQAGQCSPLLAMRGDV